MMNTNGEFGLNLKKCNHKCEINYVTIVHHRRDVVKYCKTDGISALSPVLPNPANVALFPAKSSSVEDGKSIKFM